MNIDNKTILITGLLIGSIIAMYLGYKDIALAIVSGLVGYLSKDLQNIPDNTTAMEDEDNLE